MTGRSKKIRDFDHLFQVPFVANQQQWHGNKRDIAQVNIFFLTIHIDEEVPLMVPPRAVRLYNS